MITSQRNWPRYLVYGLGTLAITAIATAASAVLFGPVLGHFESFMEGFVAILPLTGAATAYGLGVSFWKRLKSNRQEE